MTKLIASIGVVGRDEDAATVSPRAQHGRLKKLQGKGETFSFTRPGIGSWEGVNETVAVLSNGHYADSLEAVLALIEQKAPYGCGNIQGHGKVALFVERIVQLGREFNQHSVWVGAFDVVSDNDICRGFVISCDHGTITPTRGRVRVLPQLGPEQIVKAFKGKNYTLALNTDYQGQGYLIVDEPITEGE